MFDVTALGEVLIDFTEAGTSGNGTSLFERNPGGAPANVLVALQHLGHPTAFMGKVGCDMHGDFLRGVLESEGIDCTGLISDPNFFTTLAFVALAPTGRAHVLVCAQAGRGHADFPRRPCARRDRQLQGVPRGLAVAYRRARAHGDDCCHRVGGARTLAARCPMTPTTARTCGLLPSLPPSTCAASCRIWTSSRSPMRSASL